MTDSEADSHMNKFFENYILVDIGANLTNRKFGRDLESVVTRAKDSGVTKMIVSSRSLKTSRESLRLTRIYPGILYATAGSDWAVQSWLGGRTGGRGWLIRDMTEHQEVRLLVQVPDLTAGVHPHEARSWTEESLTELREVASNPECVAIGECGLDYNRAFSPPDLQRQVFRQQVELACELQKPLFLHEREAQEDLLTILTEVEEAGEGGLPPLVLSSFTGSHSQAVRYLQRGMYLAITGYLAKDNSENGVQALLEGGELPLEQLLVQSDSPFMYPNARAAKLPDRVKEALTQRSLSFLQRYCTFQRNEPCSLPTIVEMVAAFLRRTPEDIALSTSFNALKVFGLV